MPDNIQLGMLISQFYPPRSAFLSKIHLTETACVHSDPLLIHMSMWAQGSTLAVVWAWPNAVWCRALYLIRHYNPPLPHSALSDGMLSDHCTVTSLYSVWSGSAATRRGSALQPRSFSWSLCCRLGRRVLLYKRLHYGSGTRALLHYGFHIRAFIPALLHSNELCCSSA